MLRGSYEVTLEFMAADPELWIDPAAVSEEAIVHITNTGRLIHIRFFFLVLVRIL